MSQFGMRTQAGRQARASSMDVYTVLAFVALAAVIAAAAVIFGAATTVGADGSPIALQERGNISLVE